MSDVMGTTSIYLLPGMQAKMKVNGYFVDIGDREIATIDSSNVKRTLINGFAVQYEDVGTIEAVPNEPAVIYTHKKFGLNKVFFFARTGEISVVDVIAVPIHDHSSILSGGPAFGSYFSDDESMDS